MTAETTIDKADRRWRAAGLVFAAVWTAGAAALFVAGVLTADQVRPEAPGWLMAIAGLVMLLGSGPLWKEARA